MKDASEGSLAQIGRGELLFGKAADSDELGGLQDLDDLFEMSRTGFFDREPLIREGVYPE